MVFKIEFYEPFCERLNPELNLYGNLEQVGNGQVVNILDYLYIELKNNDGIACFNSSFNVDVEVPYEWNSFISPDMFSSSPDYPYMWLTNFTITIPQNALSGEYAIFINLNNLDSGLSTTKNFTMNVTSNASLICHDGCNKSLK